MLTCCLSTSIPRSRVVWEESCVLPKRENYPWRKSARNWKPIWDTRFTNRRDDEQLVADLIEVGNIAKSNRGYLYLLTVVDVLSKYA